MTAPAIPAPVDATLPPTSLTDSPVATTASLISSTDSAASPAKSPIFLNNPEFAANV